MAVFVDVVDELKCAICVIVTCSKQTVPYCTVTLLILSTRHYTKTTVWQIPWSLYQMQAQYGAYLSRLVLLNYQLLSQSSGDMIIGSLR